MGDLPLCEIYGKKVNGCLHPRSSLEAVVPFDLPFQRLAGALKVPLNEERGARGVVFLYGLVLRPVPDTGGTHRGKSRV